MVGSGWMNYCSHLAITPLGERGDAREKQGSGFIKCWVRSVLFSGGVPWWKKKRLAEKHYSKATPTGILDACFLFEYYRAENHSGHRFGRSKRQWRRSPRIHYKIDQASQWAYMASLWRLVGCDEEIRELFHLERTELLYPIVVVSQSGSLRRGIERHRLKSHYPSSKL